VHSRCIVGIFGGMARGSDLHSNPKRKCKKTPHERGVFV